MRHLRQMLRLAGDGTSAREIAQRLGMSIPGVGTITATAFATAIEDPNNFRKSRSVGAWLGLTTRRYQSGEVDYDGHISRRGDGNETDYPDRVSCQRSTISPAVPSPTR